MDTVPERLRAILLCPACGGAPLEADAGELVCSACATRYAVSRGRPVLLRPDNDVFRTDAYLAPPPARGKSLKRFIPEPSVNLSVEPMIDRLAGLLPGDARILVVGAGTQKAWLAPKFGPTCTILYCDIDVGADVDLFCDAHDLPFADASMDAVVTTAVLEHVLYPERVAAEITRVVKPGGLLYSELPFMQQVHEGAYDFTRYTLSGHRRLFNRFDAVESGMVAGPATSLVWAIENFAAAFPSNPRTRQLMRAASRIAFGWIKHADRLLKDRPQAMDGASCTFLLGRRRDAPLSDAAIVQSYVGGRPLSHG